MNRVRKNKVYLTRRLKRQVILTRREEGLSQIRVLGVNIRISPRITIRDLVLKIKHHRILQHQEEGICLTTLLKAMNKWNLSNVGNFKDHITTSIVRTRRGTLETYTLSRRRKQLEI